MRTRVEFTGDAERELAAAAAWYAERGQTLARRLRLEVAAAVEAISVDPARFASDELGTRRALLRRFPYALVYRLGPSVAVIVAVMHLSREPGYWRERLD